VKGPHIDVEGLAYHYPDGTEALRGISFRVEPSEAVALVGANGAGKSTLLQHMNGTLLPGGGRLSIYGLPVTSANLRAVRQKVGMVFQDPDDQLFMPTVAEDVAFGPQNLGFSGEALEIRVKGALAAVEALALAPKPPYRLSAGEKRRVAIATALAMEPAVLVLDEPTAGLDPRSRRHLLRLLQVFEHTKLIATHDLDLVLDLCPRTLVIHEGRIMADGPTREIFMNDALLATCHLERPLSLQGCPVCGKAGSPPGPPGEFRA
jgi:cobalt/nickel transport system ATP-binding protein